MLDPDAPTSKIRFRVSRLMENLVVTAEALATYPTGREGLLETARSLLGDLKQEVEPFLDARRELSEKQRKSLSPRQIEQIVHGLRMAEPITRRNLNYRIEQADAAIQAIFQRTPIVDDICPHCESTLTEVDTCLKCLVSTADPCLLCGEPAQKMLVCHGCTYGLKEHLAQLKSTVGFGTDLI
ncbi:MAG: hypothetical protein KC800_06230 [Candidatus Eremiobacteraeota bacterium]|nr:hypothetical protein [Candidatus Eremiobacteraeota bacterium]